MRRSRLCGAKSSLRHFRRVFRPFWKTLRVAEQQAFTFEMVVLDCILYLLEDVGLGVEVSCFFQNLLDNLIYSSAARLLIPWQRLMICQATDDLRHDRQRFG